MKYRDRGFTVLGINASNDPAAEVEKLVRELGLKQPILLRGADVANRDYAVRSFPTHFWINREGRVEETSSGWSGPRALEQKILELLK